MQIKPLHEIREARLVLPRIRDGMTSVMTAETGLRFADRIREATGRDGDARARLLIISHILAAREGALQQFQDTIHEMRREWHNRSGFRFVSEPGRLPFGKLPGCGNRLVSHCFCVVTTVKT